jgi:carbohydrate kinase (thermoresistant glucokinase family)
VSEGHPADPRYAQNMGYAQSKVVTEHLVQRAAEQTGMSARTLRVGQITADTQHGVWNATEAIPLMLQAAITVGVIPTLDESPLWLPVDVVAEAVTEISLSNAGASVMNVVAPKAFHWTRDLLPKLRAAGLEFEELGQREWINRLRKSDPDPAKNPPIKLLDFFAKKYDNDQTVRKGLQYDTAMAQSFSPALAAAQVLTQDLVTKFVTRFLATSWALSLGDATSIKRKIIVVGGPCGAGKTTVATAIAQKLNSPYIEGDTYHDPAAVAKMASSTGLTDEDRWEWLRRLRTISSYSALQAPSGVVVLTCSALKKSYRDILRGKDDTGVETAFLLLQVDGEQDLAQRLEKRSGHYMKQAMVNEQLQLFEQPDVDEVDVLPVDATKSREEVIAEALELVQSELL